MKDGIFLDSYMSVCHYGFLFGFKFQGLLLLFCIIIPHSISNIPSWRTFTQIVHPCYCQDNMSHHIQLSVFFHQYSYSILDYVPSSLMFSFTSVMYVAIPNKTDTAL